MIRVTSEGIKFNIHKLKEGAFYFVEYKGERYVIVKRRRKLVIYRMGR